MYVQDGAKIFPKFSSILRLDGFLGPKYGKKGLEAVLSRYFGECTLEDCSKPILISAFDVNNYRTHYFSSRLINPTSKGSESRKRFRIVDICRATSAAPTYFSPHHYSLLDHASQTYTTHNMIDGGVFVNNPSLAAILEVLENAKDPLYAKQPGGQIKLEDIFVLSIGTGVSAKTITKKQGARWGKITWAKNLFDIMIEGNSQSVHNQTRALLPEKQYLRLNVSIPSEFSSIDDSSKETRNELRNAVTKEVFNDALTLSRISNFVRTAQL
jgi:patatin-like phospholipase/acyl hydrolase